MDFTHSHRGHGSGTIQVLIVEDLPIVRYGYRCLLENTGDISIVAEADNGEDGYEAYKQYLPDVVIMDLSLPGAGGLNAIRRITQRNRHARVMAFSPHEDRLFMNKAREAGAIGYVSKRSTSETLIEAIRQTAVGTNYFHIDDARIQALSIEQQAIDQLTSREFEVFQLLAQGLSVHDISMALNISQNTAGVHQTRIMSKLGLQNSAQLARLAIRTGIVNP
jgi:two-component system invasion response regulator UvrY